jgi:arylformamidase
MRRVLLTFLSSVLCLLSSACHLRARSKVAEQVTFHDNLNYSADADKDTGFDLYLPRNAPGKTPGLVFIHGGYWRNQARSYYQWYTGLYQNFGLALAKRGIATAVIDYRLHPRAGLKDQLADVEAAVGFLKKNAATYNIDAARLYLSGHSAGGHLALMELWQKKNPDVRGVIALSPILDVGHMRQHQDADFNRELTIPFFGNGTEDTKHSPATYVTADAPPVLILFGDQDYAYLVEQGTTYREKFKAAGLTKIRIETLPETDHSDMVLDVNTSDDKVSDVIAAYISQTGVSK